MDRAETVTVELVYCAGPGLVDLQALELPSGATLAQALLASGMAERHGLPSEGLRFGIWGKARDAATVLRARDRIEIYRPLTVDPKEARRQRYRRHRDKAARG
ncbi:MAG: RnfH family protein [Rubrivivax sp.]|nr:RnfH family protein [Rubrivivax sp.]